MASKLFPELSTLDLSRTVVSKSEILAVLAQRGCFELMDGILHLDLEGKVVVGYKDIMSGDWWTADHIPGRPLFPGALMIEASAQLCAYDFFQRRPDLADSFVGFAGLNGTRFRSTVEPDCRMLFAGRVTRIRRSMFTYDVQGIVGGKLVFETEIIGMVV